MQTSCPECRTTFRVSQEHLGLRRGLVRCGHCNAVFNAYDTLLPELEGAPLDQDKAHRGEAETTDALAGVTQAMHQEGMAEPLAYEAMQDTEPMGPEEVLADVDASLSILSRQALSNYGETAALSLNIGQDETEGEGEVETLSEMPEPPKALKAESPEAILLSDLPNRHPSRPLPGWKLGLYLVMSLVLAVSLAGQLAYYLRAELAAAVPASRPLLNALCQPLDCVVPLPRQLTRQAIVSSSLEHDTEQKSRVSLSFLLANRTNQIQAWPHIVLTLSDVRESSVARKAFAPETYLPRGISARAGFPPQSEQEVRMELDIGSLAAASYTLNVAYP